LVCGEAIAAGDAVYYKSDGKIYKADSDATTTMPAIGIAGSAGTSAGTTTVILHGIYRNDTLYNWGTVGGALYVSGTAGALTQTQPTATDAVIQVVGLATHADRVYVAPTLLWFTHT
jgi:hypothetical protein